jgi:hypothetical protein
MAKVMIGLSLACLLTLSSTGLASEVSWVVSRSDRREGGRLDLKTVFVGKRLAGFRTHKPFRGRYLKGRQRYVLFKLDTKGDRRWDYGIYFDRVDVTSCLLAGGRYHEDYGKITRKRNGLTCRQIRMPGLRRNVTWKVVSRHRRKDLAPNQGRFPLP